jgi:hypothetical protein
MRRFPGSFRYVNRINKDRLDIETVYPKQIFTRLLKHFETGIYYSLLRFILQNCGIWSNWIIPQKVAQCFQIYESQALLTSEYLWVWIVRYTPLQIVFGALCLKHKTAPGFPYDWKSKSTFFKFNI